LRPHHFTKERGVLAAKQKVDTSLVEASKVGDVLEGIHLAPHDVMPHLEIMFVK
jgi:hypothetical protein